MNRGVESIRHVEIAKNIEENEVPAKPGPSPKHKGQPGLLGGTGIIRSIQLDRIQDPTIMKA
jgi:hypothetical protein